ncbi:MAG: hypothetical protein HRT58_08640 [Crocinitomicaceae bacterium]|nr:hypothetical protein [Flavobacteriales bacterium]NQZ35717.1 hypothetical protein [Crocinitomicaceae bacterium]
MKYVLFLFAGLLLASCATPVPLTDKLRDEFGLDDETSMAKVQFLTSATIILERSKETGNQGTTSDGTLIQNSNKEQERIIIPIGTKCVFESFDDENIIVRFEPGVGHTISFGKRQGQSSGKYYLLADWTKKEGGQVEYANSTYYATTSSGTAYIQVTKKKLQKTKRKDRVVKGMKV